MKRKAGIIAGVILGCAAMLYLAGLLGQLLDNYSVWQAEGDIAGQAEMSPVDWNLFSCLSAAFTASGLKSAALLLIITAAVAVYLKFDRFRDRDYDPRGFTLSRDGTYGTAAWMSERELREVLEVKPIGRAEGIILGERDGSAVCLPADTRLNRHIAKIGASGTMKSRAVIRPALFNIIRRGESAIITDSKGELFSDTAELFRAHGYEVKVFNLVNPAPGRHKCAYFVVLSDQDATMTFLSSLFFSFLFIKLVRYADSTPEMRCAVPVNLILDEFNNIGKLGGAADDSDFTRTLSAIRSRAIYVMLAVQSLGQLQNRYPNNLWAEIIGNTDVQLMLGCTDDVTAEYFSERSGDMSIRISSTMTVRKTMAVAQVIPEYRQTQGQGKRRLLTPDEVLRLPNDELLVVIRGHNILRLKKLDYTRLPMSGEIVKTSLMDYAPEHVSAPTETKAPVAEEAAPRKRRGLYSSAKPPEGF